MTTLPFEMSVSTTKPYRAKEILTCVKLLREVPNKRCVYQAVWNSQKVIAKVFEGFASHLRLKKEWNGLKELIRRKLDAPQPCFYGTTNDSCYVLVSKEITNASTAVEIYQNNSSPISRYNVLSRVVKELAKLNNQGVLQKDIHLGNFFISSQQVFSLDAGQMTFHTKPLSRKKSWGQLAAILTFSSDEQASKNLCLEYAKIRNWDLTNLDETAVKKHVCSYRKYVIRRVLKKTLRTSKHFIKVKKNAYTGMFSRKFIGQSDSSALFEQVDELMDNGRILKKGNTCYVSRINWANRDIVVKRYNYKGFLHSIRNTIKGSRARLCWLHGHLLEMLAIATPKPLCFFEERKGLIIRKSYIITEYEKGQKLSEILLDQEIKKEKRQQLKILTSELVKKIHANNITHGDLKHSNILVNGDNVIFTDLDGLKRHWFKALYRRRSKKDLVSLASIA